MDWLKLVECRQTPTRLFTIFDYTKIGYLIQSAFCLREIINTTDKPTFIPIDHKFQEMLELFWFKNNLITVEKIQHNAYTINFYSSNDLCETFKIHWQFQAIKKIHAIHNENILIIVAEQLDESTAHETAQVMFFQCSTKVFLAKGLLQTGITQVVLGPNNSLSILSNNHIKVYKNEFLEKGIGRIYKDRQYSHAKNQNNKQNCCLKQLKNHLWVDGQLILYNQKSAYIVVDQQICQKIPDFHRLHTCIPLISGFMACDGCIIKICKKKNGRFEIISEFSDQSLLDCSNVRISPQQDIFAYYSQLNQSILYCNKLQSQIQEQQSKKKSETSYQNTVLFTQQINHQKTFDFTIFSSNQPFFCATNFSDIYMYSSNQYCPFLNFKLKEQNSNQKPQNDLLEGKIKIRTIAIHPNRPILAVGLNKCIKILYFTFNEVKLLKQFQVSMCSFMVFNNSGSMLCTIVAGKNGAKINIFKINELNHQFVLIETMNVSRKILKVFWHDLDYKIYCVFKEGFYEWTLGSRFREKRQIMNFLKFEIIGATFLKNQSTSQSRQEFDHIVFWGPKSAAIATDNGVTVEEFSIKCLPQIRQIFYMQENFIFVLSNGHLCKNKAFDLQQCLNKSFDLKILGSDFDLQLQQDNRLIYISSSYNIKFYEFGKVSNDFSQIVGIQKKKITKLLTQHISYEKDIKRLKDMFSNTLLEIKYDVEKKQSQRAAEYSKQLSEHIDRQIKVRQQKSKLQEHIENSLKLKQKQSLGQIKQLERLYQRKLALTTNKLLTQKQIGYRDKLTADNSLKVLEQKQYNDIEKIREQFANYIKKEALDKEAARQELLRLKKNYESRLYDLQQENQMLLQDFQNKTDDSVANLKRKVIQLQKNYSQCLSVKKNVEQTVQQKSLQIQILNQKMVYINKRKQQIERKCENFSDEIEKIMKTMEERQKTIKIYQLRIKDLQKSNQVMKYRVLELKKQNDPNELEITELKANLTDLQEQHDRIIQDTHQKSQKIQIIRKQKDKLKDQFQSLNQKQQKLYKRHQQLIQRVRQATKCPIQSLRKQLLGILQKYSHNQNSHAVLKPRADSPLGQLNRIRDHLQFCLDEAVVSNKKNEQQRKTEIMKKSSQNSQLLKEINILRITIKGLEKSIKQKDIKINRLLRGQISCAENKQTHGSQGDSRDALKTEYTAEKQSRSNNKTRTRQTLYEKSMFKSGLWRESSGHAKRLKTDHGYRKKSSLSMMRDKTQYGRLAIAPINEEIQEYKRIIQQKDIFIEKLIAKIQGH